MNKAKSVIAVGATLLGCVTFGGVAGAAPNPPSDRQAPLPAATCSDYGSVIVTADTLRIRAGKGTNYDILKTVKKGDKLSCYPVETGGRYSACGVTNANGWIPIDFRGDISWDGYVASACVKDA
ncbi:SH3 domain-containing protein [Saccharothrix saharensis]|uniref:SH3 domain-containing protein n=1 Tax=Saccharothrix saharensis TaxID=571190 RepID=UPI0036BC2E2D